MGIDLHRLHPNHVTALEVLMVVIRRRTFSRSRSRRSPDLTWRRSDSPVPHAAQAVLLFLISVACTGCGIWGNNVVKVKVIFAAPGSDRQLTNLSVIAGSDKYSLAQPRRRIGQEHQPRAGPG